MLTTIITTVVVVYLIVSIIAGLYVRALFGAAADGDRRQQ